MCARQSGKSTIVAGKTLYKARFKARSLSLIASPSQEQSKELMKKIEGFLVHDRDLVPQNNAQFEKVFPGGSRIVALPGTEKSVRGYSGPDTIIIDEAARVLDETYRAIRPMMVGADTEIIGLTTPHGTRGWFWNAWENSRTYRKILVRAEPEERYRRYWSERGVSAYYSPRHDRQFLQEELEEIGEAAFRQEYCCEFVHEGSSLFGDIADRLVSDDVNPLDLEREPAADVEPLYL